MTNTKYVRQILSINKRAVLYGSVVIIKVLLKPEHRNQIRIKLLPYLLCDFTVNAQNRWKKRNYNESEETDTVNMEKNYATVQQSIKQ